MVSRVTVADDLKRNKVNHYLDLYLMFGSKFIVL